MRYFNPLDPKWLYEYLRDFDGSIIPEMAEIKKTHGPHQSAVMAKLLGRLQKQGLILWVHGGKYGKGQHHAIRIKENNKVLKTDGSPFDI